MSRNQRIKQILQIWLSNKTAYLDASHLEIEDMRMFAISERSFLSIFAVPSLLTVSSFNVVIAAGKREYNSLCNSKTEEKQYGDWIRDTHYRASNI